MLTAGTDRTRKLTSSRTSVRAAGTPDRVRLRRPLVWHRKVRRLLSGILAQSAPHLPEVRVTRGMHTLLHYPFSPHEVALRLLAVRLAGP